MTVVNFKMTWNKSSTIISLHIYTRNDCNNSLKTKQHKQNKTNKTIPTPKTQNL